jgi:hypothetical protein
VTRPRKGGQGMMVGVRAPWWQTKRIRKKGKKEKRKGKIEKEGRKKRKEMEEKI